MRLTMGLAACLLLAAAEGKSKDKDAKADHPLEGVWKVEKLVANGNEIEAAKGSKFTFKGSKLTREAEEGPQTYTFKLDPSKKPATVDFSPDEGDLKGKTLKGIYKLQGGELHLALSLDPEAKRPADFPKESDELVLITLKRDKGDGPKVPKKGGKVDKTEKD
jgi:uncharacterized protein (TIGR03067 family)